MVLIPARDRLISKITIFFNLLLIAAIFHSSPGFAEGWSHSPTPSNSTSPSGASYTRNAEIGEVIEIFSRVTKHNFIFDDRLKGRVSLYFPNEVTVREADALLKEILALKGFVAVRISAKLWKIVPADEASKSSSGAYKAAESDDVVEGERVISFRELRSEYRASSPGTEFRGPPPTVAPTPNDGKVVQVSETKFLVKDEELTKQLENMPLLLTQARAVPYFQDGKAIGFRLFAIKSGSLYERIGLRNGDVIKSVDGVSMADPSQVLKLFEALKEARSIEVLLERQKEDLRFRYQLQ